MFLRDRVSSQTVSRLAVESGLIVISVVLGFAVSEWRQASSDRQLADRVLRNVRIEIEHNLTRVEERLSRHQRMIQAFGSVELSDDRQSGFDVMLATLNKLGGGMDLAPLRQGAWDAAVSAGALRLMDYDVASALSEIYGAQAHLIRMTDHLYVVYQPTTFERGKQRESVQMLHTLLMEVENSLKALLDLYQKHLPQLRAATE